MDIEMPHLDGISAARAILQTHATAILILSAYSDQETADAARAAGISGYLVKPATSEQVDATLRSALERFRAAGNKLGQ